MKKSLLIKHCIVVPVQAEQVYFIIPKQHYVMSKQIAIMFKQIIDWVAQNMYISQLILSVDLKQCVTIFCILFGRYIIKMSFIYQHYVFPNVIHGGNKSFLSHYRSLSHCRFKS